MRPETETDAAWPADERALIAAQQQLADLHPEAWSASDGSLRIGACWVCFPRGLAGPGSAEDPAWAAAVVMADGAVLDGRVISRRTIRPPCPRSGRRAFPSAARRAPPSWLA